MAIIFNTNVHRATKWNKENRERRNASARLRYAANKDEVLKRRREIAAVNPERKRAYTKKWSDNNRDSVRNTRLIRTTGVTLIQYEGMLKSQLGLCAICNHASEDGKNLAVDHCHKTGVVRGLLCARCNTGIGLLREDSVVLQNAISYLKKEYGA